jgi:hypothetical protein
MMSARSCCLTQIFSGVCCVVETKMPLWLFSFWLVVPVEISATSDSELASSIIRTFSSASESRHRRYLHLWVRLHVWLGNIWLQIWHNTARNNSGCAASKSRRCRCLWTVSSLPFALFIVNSKCTLQGFEPFVVTRLMFWKSEVNRLTHQIPSCDPIFLSPCYMRRFSKCLLLWRFGAKIQYILLISLIWAMYLVHLSWSNFPNCIKLKV